jgi:hypothetical protein
MPPCRPKNFISGSVNALFRCKDVEPWPQESAEAIERAPRAS